MAYLVNFGCCINLLNFCPNPHLSFFLFFFFFFFFFNYFSLFVGASFVINEHDLC